MHVNGEIRPPAEIGAESLSIEVTTDCNSSCPHCFARAGLTEPARLAPDLVKEILREGFTAGYRHFHITGGEPLLWRGLFAVLEYGLSLGYKAAFLNTNGTLITDGTARRLAEFDALSLSVSLEASQSIHDLWRGKDSYRKTLQGIEKGLEAGIKIYIFTTAPKPMLAELPNAAVKIYKRFPRIQRLILIQIIRVKHDTVDLSKEVLDPEDFLGLVRTVSLLNLSGYKTDVLNEPLVNVASKIMKMPWIPRSRPLIRQGSMVIRANREITLSHSNRDNSVIYESGTIKSVLGSESYRAAVGPDETTCPPCEFFQLCRENGMVRPSGWYMDMHPETPYCKRVLKKASI